MLAISPIFHGFGLIESILAALGLNMSVDLHPQYNKPIFVKSLLKNKPALVLGVPTLWDNLIKDKKLNKSDFVPGAWISGGDKLTEHLKAKINKFRNEHQNSDEMGTGYGFTEGGAAVTISKHNGELSEQSVGYPLPHNNVKIINQTTGEECGYGEKAMKVFLHLRPDPEFGTRSCLAAGIIHANSNQYEKAMQDFEIGLKHQEVSPEVSIELRYRYANACFATKNTYSLL